MYIICNLILIFIYFKLITITFETVCRKICKKREREFVWPILKLKKVYTII